MTANYLKTIVKKLWVIFFTDKPYKIKKFASIFDPLVGQPVDTPESLSSILMQEQGEIVFYPPVSGSLIKDINYRYIEGKERFKSSGIFKQPNRYVYSLTKGCILGQCGLIYDIDSRTYIDESAKEWVINLKQSAYTNLVSFPVKNKLPGVTLSCLTIGADLGFYHFLFESLIKIHIYQSVISHFDFVLFNAPCTDWKLKWIKRANIDINKIVWAVNTSHFECEQLIFTNKLINDQQISPWCIKSLKELFKISLQPALSPKSTKILWISRKGLKVREIEWESILLSHFPAIERVDLSSLDENQTISKMLEASHVIAPHGAGLSNIYLCRPNTKILEIFPDGAFFQPCYSRLSAICKLNHSIIYLDFNNCNNEKFGLTALIDIVTKFIC